MANGSRTRVERTPKVEPRVVEVVDGVSSSFKKASLYIGTTTASTIAGHAAALFIFVRPTPMPPPPPMRMHSCFHHPAPAMPCPEAGCPAQP